QRVAAHLDICPACERAAAELSDDQEARELAAAAGGQPAEPKPEPQVEDLCKRLVALGLYESALDEAEEDTRPGLDPEPSQTSVLSKGRAPQTVVRPTVQNLPAVALPATSELTPSCDPAIDGRRLKRLGRYEIVRLLGAGTFGIVYLAQDCKLNRPVALKIARATVLADDHLRLRFIREAETLAKLRHPHIVPVYEADEVEGLCYLAIAFVDGPSLDEWLRQQEGPLDSRLAVKLLLPLVDAVEHAHAHGVLHRDIKPGNIILERAEENTDGLTVVSRLTDFGLAKVVEEKSSSTISGIVLGTAEYMAPEQAAGHVERIGRPTDIYGLGAVLYHMLTGRPPICGNTTIDTLRRLLVDEPAEVRTLNRNVPADLDAIVLRCLNKQVQDRYATAAEMAADLRRFLEGHPTIARPLSLRQRVGRWLHRNPTLTSAIALATIAVCLTVGWYRASQMLGASTRAIDIASSKSERMQRQLAQTREELEERARQIALSQYHDAITAAERALAEGDVVQALTALQGQIPPPLSPPTSDLRGLEWHYLYALATQTPLAEAFLGSEIYQIRLSPDRREVAAACRDSVLRLYDSRKLTELKSIATDQIEINGVAYSPDGKVIATAGDDGTIKIYDLGTRELLVRILAHSCKSYGVTFYDGSSKLASCGEESRVRLWDAASGDGLGYLDGHSDLVEALALSPDGRYLATASSDRTCRVWDLREERLPQILSGHTARLTSVWFSPDGRQLATGCLDKQVALWDLATGRRTTESHLDQVQSVCFSSSGEWLFAGDRSGAVRKYRIGPGPYQKLVRDPAEDTWQAHDTRVWATIPGPEEGTLLTCGARGYLKLWGGVRRQVRRVCPETLDDNAVDLAFSGEQLFVLHGTGGIEMLDAATLATRGWLTARLTDWNCLEVMGAEEVAAGDTHGNVAIWNHRSGVLRRIISHPDENFTVLGLVYSQPARLLAVLPATHHLRLYKSDTGEPAGILPTNNHTAAAISPDGRQLAVDTSDNILLYDPIGKGYLDSLRGHRQTIYGLAYSPSGRLLASASADRTARLWGAQGGEPRVLGGHRAGLADVAFTPDEKTLVTIDDAGVLKLTHVATARTLLDIPTDTKSLRALAVAPDSRRLAVLRQDYSILLIGAPPEKPGE
ncbi:MAG TPA: protein kinase, partial [Pirellulaceae bacterium]|nr:protein kinase [Pirellulaceae bacterium]